MATTAPLTDQASEILENDGSLAACEDYGAPDPAKDDTDLQKAIRDLCKHFAQLDRYARRSEVIDARRQRFYRRDDQYIITNKEGIFEPWTGGSQGSNAADSPRYTDVYNIYWPYMRAMVALGVQNPPGVNFDPDDATKSTDIAAARNAEVYRHQIDRVNKRKDLQGDIFSLFCTDTRVVLYSRSVRDAQKFGSDDDGAPNSVEIISAHGTLETKVPITAKDQSQWPYAILSDDPDINMAKQEYPQYAGEIRSGGGSAIGESSYERFARIGVIQGTSAIQNAGDAYAHLAPRHRVWLRPAAYNHVEKKTADQLRQAYPSGLKVTFVGDTYCGSLDCSMDDQLCIGFPGPGDGMSRSSLLKSMVVLQDAFNDYKNLEKEIFDFCLPMGYRLAAVQDIEAVREQRSEPGNMTVVGELPAGLTSLAAAFFIEPPAEAPPSLIEAYNNLQGALSQFITGAQPALFGGADKNNDTASGISMLRDQAMGQFGIAWGNFQELMACAYKQAVLCAARSKGDDAVVNVSAPSGKGKMTNTPVQLGAITKGSFHSHPNTNSSFPETTASKRQTVQTLAEQAWANPMATEAYGINLPENLDIQRQLLAIEGWIIPGAAAREKQMAEIELLLKQKPVPDLHKVQAFAADVAMEGELASKLPLGAPKPNPPQPDPAQLMDSTVKVDIQFDFHEAEFQTVKDWLTSADGQEAAKTNPAGFLNVRLHGLEHQAAMAPPPMMLPPGGPAPPPAGPPNLAAPNAPQATPPSVN